MPIGSAASAGAAGRFLHIPTSLSSWLPGQIVKTSPTTYVPSFTFAHNVPNVGVTYYLDPALGSGSNSGLTPSAPLQTFAQCYAKSDIGRIEIAAGAIFDRTQDVWTNQTFARSIAIHGDPSSPAQLLGSDLNIAWTVNGTYSNVYQYNRTNVNVVRDSSILDSDGLWTKYTLQTSVANVSAIAGSWYSDGVTVFVRTLDDRPLIPPDNSIQVMVSTSAVFKPTIPDIVISMENIQFLGVQTVGARANSATVYPKVWANNCTFNYTETTTNGWQGLGADRFFFNCTSQGNLADGFNDHVSGRIANAFEWNCNGSFNGDVTTAVNDNGSTMHDGGKVIRMYGTYSGNYGPNMADVSNATVSLAINCTTTNSRKAASPNNVTSGGDSFGGTKMYLINHVASQSGGASGYKDVVTASGGTVRYLPGTGNATLTLNGSPATLVKCSTEAELFSV